MKKFILFFGILALFPSYGRAAVMGTDFLHKCSMVIKSDTTNLTDGEYDDLFFCEGFLEGVNYILGQKEAAVSVPESITIGQQARIVVKYMNQHPEQLNLDGGSLFLLAMRESYPKKSILPK
jgi:hypothetical protein